MVLEKAFKKWLQLFVWTLELTFWLLENENEQSNYSSSEKPLRLLQRESQRDVIYGNCNLIYTVET